MGCFVTILFKRYLDFNILKEVIIINGDLENRVIEGTKVLYTGPMCASKSLQLIHAYGQLTSIKQEVYPFVHASNDSMKSEIVSRLKGTEGEISIPASKVRNSMEILFAMDEMIWSYLGRYPYQSFSWNQSIINQLKENDKLVSVKGMLRWNPQIYVLIDEINFFDGNIKEVIQKLSYYGVNVIAGGLEHDFRKELFTLSDNVTVSDIAGISDEHIKLNARCQYQVKNGIFCGDKAIYTQRFRDVAHMEPSHYSDELIISDKRLYVPVCREHHYVPGKFN